MISQLASEIMVVTAAQRSAHRGCVTVTDMVIATILSLKFAGLSLSGDNNTALYGAGCYIIYNIV